MRCCRIRNAAAEALAAQVIARVGIVNQGAAERLLRICPEASLLYRVIGQEESAASGWLLNAMPALGLTELAPRVECCWQPMRYHVLRLEALGLKVADATVGTYAWAGVLPMKSKRATLGMLARAWSCLAEGGRLWFAAANRHGARSWQHILGQLGHVRVMSKSKCRLFRVVKHLRHQELLSSWNQQAEPEYLEETGLWSEPGLFSWDRLDPGTRLLLEHVPDASVDSCMDLCCGYGALAAGMLARGISVGHLTLVDADIRALRMAERNVRGFDVAIRACWLDAVREELPGRMELIVCNPPFHEDQHRDSGLGQSILARACNSLRNGGQLWAVANRQLPYEQALHDAAGAVRVVVQQKGFKVLMARKVR